MSAPTDPNTPDPLISTQDLAALLDEAAPPVLLDASFYLPTEGKDAMALFAEAHLPGAAFFDIDRIADPDSDLPHMLPSEADFARAVEAFGVSNDTLVVVYDQRGLFSAPRAWWMFRAFGHDRVRVLDGGLPKWRREGLPVEAGPARPTAPGRFAARLRPELVRDATQIAANIEAEDEALLDARSAARYAGSVPEPRPRMRSGHVPGAISLPFTELLAEDGTLLGRDDLRNRFAEAGIGPGTRPVTMCGSGVTAAVLTLGLICADLPCGALYDGSWTEWGAEDDGAAKRPVERME